MLHAAVGLGRMDLIELLVNSVDCHLVVADHMLKYTALDLAIHLDTLPAAKLLFDAAATCHESMLPNKFVLTLTNCIEQGVPLGRSFLGARRAAVVSGGGHRALLPFQEGDVTEPLRTATFDSIALAKESDCAPVVSSGSCLRRSGRTGRIQVQVCPVPALLDHTSGLVQALARSSDNEVLCDPVVEAVLLHKWRTYGFAFFSARLSLVAVMLALASRDPLSSGGALALPSLAFAVLSERVWVASRTRKSSSINICVEVVALALVLGLAVSSRLELVIQREVVCVAVFALWLQALLLLRGFEHTAALIGALQSIVADALPFLLVLVVAMMGFGQAFAAFIAHGVRADDGADGGGRISGTTEEHMSFAESLHLAYQFVVSGDGLKDGEGLTADLVEEPWLLFLWYVCSAFGTVVMLNMLIALMGDSFERVQSLRIAELRRHRAALLCEIDACIPDFVLRRLNPRGYLYMGRPAQAGGADDESEWFGFVGEIRKDVRRGTSDLRQEIEHATANIEQQFLKQTMEQKTEAEEMKQAIASNERRTEEVKQAIASLRDDIFQALAPTKVQPKSRAWRGCTGAQASEELHARREA